MGRKIGSVVRGLKPPGAGSFYYPQLGFGQITERLHQVAKTAGANFLFGAKTTALQRDGNQLTGVRYEHNGQEHEISSSLIWSTLPLTLLLTLIRPEAPPEALSAPSP